MTAIPPSGAPATKPFAALTAPAPRPAGASAASASAPAPDRAPAGAPASIDGAPRRDTRAQVRKLSHQLEGVFVSQLFQAMRQTVSQGEGVMAPSPGEEMFTSMFDDAVAGQAADRMQRGLGEALYRQLSRNLPEDPAAGSPGERSR